MNKQINSKDDLEKIVDRLIRDGYRFETDNGSLPGLDITERIRPRLVALLADVGHRRGFRYGDDWGEFFEDINLNHFANNLGEIIENSGFHFVMIEVDPIGGDEQNRGFRPLDTPEGIEAAQSDLRESGYQQALVYYTCNSFPELCEDDAEVVGTEFWLTLDGEPRKRAAPADRGRSGRGGN